MFNSLSLVRRRMLAVGILLIVILLLAVVLVEPYIIAYNASVEHVESIAFKVKQSKKSIQKQQFYADEIERLSYVRSEDDIYLRSDRAALASAEIQQILKNIAKKSGSELLSSQPVFGEQTEQGRVSVQLRVRANIFGLRKLLHGLEAGTPKLFVNEISINRGSRAIYRFNDAESTSQTLDIQMQVFGYVKDGKADAT